MKLFLALVFVVALGVVVALTLQQAGMADAAGRTIGASVAAAIAAWIWANRRRLKNSKP